MEQLGENEHIVIEDTEIAEASEMPERAAVPRKAVLTHRLIMTVCAGIIGSIVGSIPVIVANTLCCKTVPIIFVTIPMAVCLAVFLLDGHADRRGLTVVIVFSLVGMYIVALFFKAAEFVSAYQMSFWSIPVVALAQAGTAGSFVFSSSYIFPMLFTAMSAAGSYLTLRRFGKK